MKVPASVYLRRYLEGVGLVASGRRGAISEDLFLLDNYGEGCYEVLEEGLSEGDPHVRMETVLLFARLRIAKARDIIEEMSHEETDLVAGACVAYLKGMDEAEERIPGLLYTVNHRSGDEFRTAMRTLGDIATAKDIPEIRKVMGQVGGEMREQTRSALSRIVDRDPDLEGERRLILSDPVYPDEGAYRAFLDRSLEYLDVRYRENVLPRSEIRLKTYNNVNGAILKMRIRIYNERPNLVLYGPSCGSDTERLEDLMRWAADDLGSKQVV